MIVWIKKKSQLGNKRKKADRIDPFFLLFFSSMINYRLIKLDIFSFFFGWLIFRRVNIRIDVGWWGLEKKMGGILFYEFNPYI